jgi:hypothetical protein
MSLDDQATSRRKFLQFAASPPLAGSDLAAMAAENPSLLPVPMLWGRRALDRLLRTELSCMMQHVGAPAIKHLVPAMVRRA